MINKKIILIVIFLLLIIFLSTQRGALNYCKNLIYSVSEPIQANFWNSSQGFSLFFKNLFSINQLIEENQKLKQENQNLLQTISQLFEVNQENQVLKQALNIELNKNFQLEFSQILAKDPKKNYILINVGENEGIKKGAPVITSDRILVGKVEEVFNDFSKVILFTANNFSFDVEIQGKEILALERGKGNLEAILDFVSKDKELALQDLVITSNLGENFPKGLIVGKVKNIETSPTQAYKTVEIEPLFSFENLDYVFIIKNFPVDVF